MERVRPEPFIGKMEFFILLEPKNGVYNVRIKGPEAIAQYGVPEMYVGIFKNFPLGEVVVIEAEQGTNVDRHTKEILELQIPEDIKSLGLKDNDKTRQDLEKITAPGNSPSSVLVFGKDSNGEEIIVLYAFLGISPETALKEIQQGMLKSIVDGTYTEPQVI